MTKAIRPRGEDVRAFILMNIGDSGLTAKAMSRFKISRQAVNLHMQKLVQEGALIGDGNTRCRSYKIAPTSSLCFRYSISEQLEEDAIWRSDIRPFIGSLPNSVLEIWHYAFTEMFNNAIDHSGGHFIIVTIVRTGLDTRIYIADDGVGIFKKIQAALNLPDQRQAIFELSKGKLTTDAKNHSGQGIFFTSRMVNNFDILSDGVNFSHEIGTNFDWMLERGEEFGKGTTVFLKVDNHTARTVKKVLSEYSVKGSYGFNKTVVPVSLAKYGTDQLISRSQAKRVLARVELFSYVIFDFKDVEVIGQAFADQIFRVFAAEHPEVKLITRHANKDILGEVNAAIKIGRPGFKGELPLTKV